MPISHFRARAFELPKRRFYTSTANKYSGFSIKFNKGGSLSHPIHVDVVTVEKRGYEEETGEC
jgi:hypothetical protein